MRLVDFGPGPGAPSLQVNLVALGEFVEEVAMSVWDGGVGDGYSIEVAGQQSQSILSSICSKVRPLCSANAVYTLDGVVEGEPPRSFHRSTQRRSACRDTILEVVLKEDRHGKEITSVSCMALFTAGFTGDVRLIMVHALRGIWSPRVGSVRHATPRESVRAPSLCNRGYKIPLHMTVEGLSVL